MKLIKISPKVVNTIGLIGSMAASSVVNALLKQYVPKPISKTMRAWFWIGTAALSLTITQRVKDSIKLEVYDSIDDLNETIKALDIETE